MSTEHEYIAALVAEALKQNARKGGKARAKSLTKKRRIEIAKLAAKSRWSKAKGAPQS